MYVNFLFVATATNTAIDTLDVRLFSQNDVTILISSSNTCDCPFHILPTGIVVMTIFIFTNPIMPLFSTSLTEAEQNILYIYWFLRSTPLRLACSQSLTSFLLHCLSFYYQLVRYFYIFVHPTVLIKYILEQALFQALKKQTKTPACTWLPLGCGKTDRQMVSKLPHVWWSRAAGKARPRKSWEMPEAVSTWLRL